MKTASPAVESVTKNGIPLRMLKGCTQDDGAG